ncbi:hypothetical protein CHELA41_23174 [Hyphomicrobiales bacterium]|nr:hypothetical protein CHELA41_23174 [Hyphomicrobiales bacterium]
MPACVCGGGGISATAGLPRTEKSLACASVPVLPWPPLDGRRLLPDLLPGVQGWVGDAGARLSALLAQPATSAAMTTTQAQLKHTRALRLVLLLTDIAPQPAEEILYPIDMFWNCITQAKVRP